MKMIKVLFVEDEPEFHKTVKAFLEGTDQFTVRTHETGGDAVALAKKERPDLIIVDILLRKDYTDGQQLAAQFRFLPEFKNVPILVLSQLKTRRQARSADKEISDREGIFYISKAESMTRILAKIAAIFCGWPFVLGRSSHEQ